MANKKLTPEEIEKITDEAMDAIERGDDEEKDRLGRLLPLGPYMAKVARDIYGKDYVQQFNLVLANEKFGESWLDREDSFGASWVNAHENN